MNMDERDIQLINKAIESVCINLKIPRDTIQWEVSQDFQEICFFAYDQYPLFSSNKTELIKELTTTPFRKILGLTKLFKFAVFEYIPYWYKKE